MKTVLTSVCAVLVFGSGVMAIPTEVVFEDTLQDPLFVPRHVHELGVNNTGTILFPEDEEIGAVDSLTNDTACDQTPGDDPGIPNAVVIMTNVTGKAWDDVWYVGDPETTLTNYDGWVNAAPWPATGGGLAFKIDSVGFNKPLIFESIAVNDIFEPNETWHFIIQDYSNALAGQPAALDSVGVGVASLGLPSTGSIIAVPEPASILLLILGSAVGVLRRARR